MGASIHFGGAYLYEVPDALEYHVWPQSHPQQ